MELTANQHHSSTSRSTPLEQNFHVRHRLERYGADGAWSSTTAPPAAIARAIAEEIGREVNYEPVGHDGARRRSSAIASCSDGDRYRCVSSRAHRTRSR